MRITSVSYLTLAAAITLVSWPTTSLAQDGRNARFEVDADRSLVWWQVNPHFGHLWATTCPNDETWQAGEGRSTQYRSHSSTNRRVRMTNVKEAPEMIPLFPRDTVRANCRHGVSGAITVADMSNYRGIQGSVRVRADSLTIGSDMRDAFARRYVYKTAAFKEIGFSLDSLTLVQIRNDTIRGIAFGLFQLRDVRRVIAVPVYVVTEPSGLRVRGQWWITATQLTDEYHVPKVYLAMGIASKLWDDLHMGFDLVFRRGAGSTNSNPER